MKAVQTTLASAGSLVNLVETGQRLEVSETEGEAAAVVDAVVPRKEVVVTVVVVEKLQMIVAVADAVADAVAVVDSETGVEVTSVTAVVDDDEARELNEDQVVQVASVQVVSDQELLCNSRANIRGEGHPNSLEGEAPQEGEPTCRIKEVGIGTLVEEACLDEKQPEEELGCTVVESVDWFH